MKANTAILRSMRFGVFLPLLTVSAFERRGFPNGQHFVQSLLKSPGKGAAKFFSGYDSFCRNSLAGLKTAP